MDSPSISDQMGPLVIDIETAERFDELCDPVKNYLVEREQRRGAEAEEPEDPATRAINALSLNPAVGTIVSIGMWLVGIERGLVLVNNEICTNPELKGSHRYNDHATVFYGSEAEMLSVFWAKVLEKAGRCGRNARYPLVTFNGRSFDGPFLMLRSAFHRIKPTRNMVGYRFNLSDHCDLQEVFSFMGALSWQHRYSLDFWCNLLGIVSPKQDMDGTHVGSVWESGDLDRLIQYSIADIQATAQLYVSVLPLIESIRES